MSQTIIYILSSVLLLVIVLYIKLFSKHEKTKKILRKTNDILTEYEELREISNDLENNSNKMQNLLNNIIADYHEKDGISNDLKNISDMEASKKMQFEVFKTEIREEGKRKNQIHDFQNSYTKLLYFIHIKDFKTAHEYAKLSAKFYRNLLNERHYADENWSISDELDVMKIFFELENIPKKDIELKINFNDIDILTTRFISGVFTTLLHNSIKHAFKNERRKNIFSINAVKKDNILYFEISDNGEPSETTAYLPDKGKENGLKIIKQRIEFLVIDESTQDENIHPFTIEPILGVGTTIKFIFPYEKIKNAAS